MAVRLLNPGAEISRRGLALHTTIAAAKGLQGVLRSNLGPNGTIKMLVSGAGDIKITKDGKVLLDEMQIKNPTSGMIARAASAQDDVCGDGTTSTVLIIGELLKKAEQLLIDGLHPRVIVDGFDLAKAQVMKWMEGQKIEVKTDRELLVSVARCSLLTKLKAKIALSLSEVVTDAVLTIAREDQPIDLHMVEIMPVMSMAGGGSRLVKGIVLDHGGRHPDMPKRVKNAYILTCNVSMEHEKSEVQPGFFYSSAEQRERLVEAERAVVDDVVRKVIALKKQVCNGNDKSFVVINQKGIDPMSLDLLAKEGILALRRAKRRNMERITLACGGIPMNSVEGLTVEDLGYAGAVYEEVHEDEKYTFVEQVKNPFSCTVLLRGPNKHTITQMKDAVRDGLRAVKNTLEDQCVLPGAGAFEVAAQSHLKKYANEKVTGKTKLGVIAFAEALLVIPKTLAETSGHDALDCIIKMEEEASRGHFAGLNLATGDPLDPTASGIYDNYVVKRQLIGLASIISTQLLLVDEILRAGRDTTR
ncbi:T-complex protein 1 subunit zeta 1 [Gracilariopsis chorda]|uniref:T-complex protein 1 subunit zeta 1 n=1 Tax=Gracilariopsis chorda TaxID=448386 RepID=A0A2V3J6S5_9FLOR|nr:T-complex protein 1 subunit zeta 1 [Gracilariopsis chorda]|eukprot:PXF50128.1 T-complex protein 1 subunit zeta 1 [Gracilariopsis chorda]